MPVPHGFVEKLAELSTAGKSFVSVTMVETVGSTPQDVGSKMLVDVGGLVFGTVGGGKVETKAIGVAQAMLHPHPSPLPEGEGVGSANCKLVEWNLQRDVGMTCGGVVKLLFESYNYRDWRIVIFGAGHVAQALVRCLLLLECRVVCVDQRDEWLAKLPQSSKLRTIQLVEPREFVDQLQPEDSVLCMTMGHKTDRPILQEIFSRRFEPRYLGVIGSQAKRKVLLRELREDGIPDNVAESFRCPIGLPIGTNQPGEIAVSIAAELIQCRDAANVERTS
jgi:xanthine dehydrogenase accessory factor